MKSTPVAYRLVKPIGALLIIALILVGLGFYYYSSLTSPVNKNDTATKIIVITKGEAFNSIANKLTKAGLIRSPLALKLAAYQASQGKTIQAGSFKLSPAMTPSEIINNLSHGKLDVWVTILEGWRLEEMAESISQVFSQNNLPFDQAKFLAAAKGKEGYLFPDTYLFPITADEATIVSLLSSTFNKKITAEDQAAIQNSGRTLHQIVTMASIVEREARTDTSRKRVAGILWKRLDNGWPLQADATLQYAKGFNKIQNAWWVPPLAADKAINSPYNTYKYTGFPPGPIAAPSLSSLKAAIYPETSSAWYYITDNNGQMHYADTIEQHNQNVNTYLR